MAVFVFLLYFHTVMVIKKRNLAQKYAILTLPHPVGEVGAFNDSTQLTPSALDLAPPQLQLLDPPI